MCLFLFYTTRNPFCELVWYIKAMFSVIFACKTGAPGEFPIRPDFEPSSWRNTRRALQRLILRGIGAHDTLSQRQPQTFLRRALSGSTHETVRLGAHQ